MSVLLLTKMRQTKISAFFLVITYCGIPSLNYYFQFALKPTVQLHMLYSLNVTFTF